MPRYNFKKEEVLEAIKESGSIVLRVARKLAKMRNSSTLCSDTAKYWIEKWEETKVAFQRERDDFIDLAENQIYTSLTQGDDESIRLSSAKYVASRLGKNRGWREGQDMTSKNETTVTNLPDVSDLTYEQMYKLRFGEEPPGRIVLENDSDKE